jgi:hypothetical protein
MRMKVNKFDYLSTVACLNMIISARRKLLILYETKVHFCFSSLQVYILKLKSVNISYNFGAYPEGVAIRMAFPYPLRRLT